MKKDMINIDDFVRDTLNGHSEKDDPAAWLKMKDLLDKEMPERAAPFYFKWGKPTVFLGAALLVGALCVGGYKLAALRSKGAGNELANQSSSTTNTSNTTNKPALSTTEPNNNNNQNTAPDQTPAPDQNPNAQQAINPVASENSNSAPVTAKAATNNKVTEDKHTSSSQSNTRRGAAKTDQNRPDEKAAEQIAAGVKSSGTQNSVAQTAKTGTAATKEEANQKLTEPKELASASAKEEKTKAKNQKNAQRLLASAAASGNKKTQRPEKQMVENRNEAAQNENSASTASNTKSTANKKAAAKDSIQSTTIRHKETLTKTFPKQIVKSTDTILKEKVAVAETKEPEVKAPINTTIVSNVELSEELIKEARAESKKANKLAAKKEAKRQKQVYAASNTGSSKSSQQNLAANKQEAGKAKKEKTGVSKWLDNMNLPEKVADAKRDAGNAKFYFGANVGLNYTFASNGNSFQGVQFGPTGELVFNKHWSLFGAVRYFNRGGGTKTVNDNYSKEISNNVVDSTKGFNSYFTVQTDSTSRYFKFSTVHSFEMPLTVRYALNKFYLMTGLNLAYYLPVNVEQVEKKEGIVGSHVVVTNTTTKPILAENKGIMSSNDFGSKFGLGYVLGCGYQITPAWQVDMKLVNSFWDNARGNGAKSLSKDFYRLPSVQLSVGYQFNRGTKKPTYGPTPAP